VEYIIERGARDVQIGKKPAEIGASAIEIAAALGEHPIEIIFKFGGDRFREQHGNRCLHGQRHRVEHNAGDVVRCQLTQQDREGES